MVLGNVGSHYIITVDKLPTGDLTAYIQNEDYDELFYGGTGLNISYNLSRLGQQCAVVTTALSGEMQGIEQLLAGVGMSVEGIAVSEGRSVGFIIEDGSKERLTILGGFYGKQQKTPHPMPDALFENAKMGIVSVDSKENVPLFLDKLEQHGLPFAFSMRSDPVVFNDDILRRAVPKAEVLFCNRFERDIIERALGLDSIQRLLSDGAAKAVCVTIGKKGSQIFYRNGANVENIVVPITQASCNIDCTGAGDAFCAGFMRGYINGKSLLECAQLGSTVSSFIIEKRGCVTNSPTLEMVAERMQTREDCKQGE